MILFSNLYKLINKTNYRVSSWDQTGRNLDFIQIKSKETRILADIDGPGIIRHIYFTSILLDPLEFRNAIIKIYWDHEKHPSVEVPLGDFFGVSNCRLRLLNSLMMTINRGILGSYGFNMYFPMPFSDHAKIEIENQGPSTLGGYFSAFWYHVDYEKNGEPLRQDTGYLHAFWNREKITKISENVPLRKKNIGLWSGKNITGKDNYVILDTEGNGQLAGLLLNIDNVAGEWYGEGDDMIFIDEDTWPPSIHGTGTEEIFGAGASPKIEFSGPYTGFHLIENFNYSGNNGMYRWYINDPIRFKKKIRWTIEHGHANNYENDYSSVAFWYQKEPHATYPPLPKLEDRIPRLPENYKEIWNQYISCAKTMMSLKRDLKETFPESLDRFFEETAHYFVMGKYELAMKGFIELTQKINEISQ